jgi:hypothetical protein
MVGTKTSAHWIIAPFLSLSPCAGFEPFLQIRVATQLVPFLIPFLLDQMRRMKSSLDRELAFWGFKHLMIGPNAGNGSNPAHGERDRKGRNDPMRRGFRTEICSLPGETDFSPGRS